MLSTNNKIGIAFCLGMAVGKILILSLWYYREKKLTNKIKYYEPIELIK